MKLPFLDSDPAYRDCQYLEDLATAYWYSEVLFAVIDLKLFEFLEQEPCGPDLEALAAAAACRPPELQRLLNVLEKLDLIHQHNGRWFNNPAARRFLVPSSDDYMGDFLLYRRYMQPGWKQLVQKVSLKDTGASGGLGRDTDYTERNFHYVRSTDTLMRQKAVEISALLEPLEWQLPILDIGGGGGALSRTLLRNRTVQGDDDAGNNHSQAVLFELPEVIEAARRIYPEPEAWSDISIVEGDFRSHSFDGNDRFGLVLLSNFLHAYNPDEAARLLQKALRALQPNGMLLIHDYFPDRTTRFPHKGALYDLNMMLNTFNGVCHGSSRIIEWLKASGMGSITVRDLATDTSVILAQQQAGTPTFQTGMTDWIDIARRQGFRRAVLMPTRNVITAPWVRMKCRFGCALYGQDRQCPPNGMHSKTTREMLDAYQWALLVEGAPPGHEFHQRLLDLEKKAFLSGLHKAFAFGAGPCPLCSRCTEDGSCRHPEQARPAMEGSGIDVYTTAKNAGIYLQPLTAKDQYVKYMGLLLLE